jgi:hypothetical protein
MTSNFRLIHKTEVIEDAKTLCGLLNWHEHVAIRGKQKDRLVRECDMLLLRGCGYKLPGFPLPILMFEIQVQGTTKSPWTVIGPTKHFRMHRAIDLKSPTLRNLKNDLEKQIWEELWWFQKLF